MAPLGDLFKRGDCYCLNGYRRFSVSRFYLSRNPCVPSVFLYLSKWEVAPPKIIDHLWALKVAKFGFVQHNSEHSADFLQHTWGELKPINARTATRSQEFLQRVKIERRGINVQAAAIFTNQTCRLVIPDAEDVEGSGFGSLFLIQGCAPVFNLCFYLSISEE